MDAVEFDVRLSADRELVVIHDATVDRTTSGSGAVAHLTLRQLRELDAGYRYGPSTYPYRDRGIRIPTVADVLDATASLEVVVEIKAVDAAEPLLHLLRARGEEGRVIVGSFVREWLLPFRRAGIRTTAASDEVRKLIVPALLGRRLHATPFTIVSVPPRYKLIPVPLGALARCVAPAGTRVHVWTVNDPGEAQRLWRDGIHGIISDDPAAILRARDSLTN